MTDHENALCELLAKDSYVGEERVNGEIKRHSGLVGVYPNEAAIRRMVGALLLEWFRSGLLPSRAGA